MSVVEGVTGGAAAETVPSVSGLAVASLTSGSCNVGSHSINTKATYWATWTVTNQDDTNYQTLVYGNAILVSTQATSAQSYTKTINGVLNDPGSSWTENVDYVIKIQKKSDSTIVSTSATVNYTADYGNCGPV